MEQLIYLLIPVIVIIVGIYFLIIHKTTCPSCGRSIRPMWRECPCASEPSIFFPQEPVQERKVGSNADIKSFSYDDAQFLPGEGMGTEVMLPSTSPACLLIEESGTPAKRYLIREMVVSIGTSEDNDVILKDRAVSRHHAKIRIEGKKYFIYDLASTNATKVNGRKITKKWIKEGDSIEIGHTSITFKLSEMPEHKPSNLLKM